ncbi:ABC transporter ATP-binding protein [Paenibacillus sp. LHD-117]|uniref:ABC transporter ATP-binding protein n=1 Tax=Paenibacillus sp. LHD-117 TaxID=3071412 RepID=UPI0027DF3CD5|nr:ABC transporter ATP-binding protein [Paenibacillus sp. LHD-117]MDQ6421798.1 ABC transporter ATP-binding protein [Paenibacillus sp. LHD-117]
MGNRTIPSIRIRQLTRRFGTKTVIHEVSLEVGQNEIFGLLGPSGSGKTTLVKMMAGIDEGTEGEVELLGTRLPKLSMMERIGYMAQSDALYGELSAQENLEFFAALFGLMGPRRKERMRYVMELVGLAGDMKQKVSAYSGGMKRRLSLAIALLHEPEVLILDEPTVGIDPVLRKSIWNELEALSGQGKTIIVTTHVMDEADKCHRLGMIRDGRLIAVGTPDSLKQETGSATIEEAFLYYGGARR